MADRQTYTVVLRAEPGVDGLRALRALLKAALRVYGLRCVRVTMSESFETPPPPASAAILTTIRQCRISPAMHVVVELPQFLSDAKAARLTNAERAKIIDHIAANPTAGDVIEGTGGARKVRFAGRGKGKSGGYRVITFYAGARLPVFLLALYGKGERANLGKAERNELRLILGSIVETYRRGVIRRA